MKLFHHNSPAELRLRSDSISLTLATDEVLRRGQKVKPYWIGEGGILFSGDCMDYLPAIRDEVVNTVFADPPFNLGKLYGTKTDDRMAEDKYLEWCKSWLRQCIRVLKSGGSLFLYNLPRWNIPLGNFLMESGLTFRHWVAVEQKSRFPIAGRLYPSHYSLLYFSKGKVKTFNKIRTPILICRHCGGEIRDYGGHRHAMNPTLAIAGRGWRLMPIPNSSRRSTSALATPMPRRRSSATWPCGSPIGCSSPLTVIGPTLRP